MTINPNAHRVLEGQMSLPFGDAADKSVEELSFYCDLEGKARISYLIVGLDTSRLPVRAVMASASYDHCRGGEMSVCPYEAAEFKTLNEFVAWAVWRGDHLRIAVPSEEADPLGIRNWLECTDCALERYDWWSYPAHLRNDTALQDIGIDLAFRRAYTLALYSGYRLHASVVCRSIWGRLLEAHHLLEDVRRDAHRLSAALDGPRITRLNEIPF